MSKILTFIVAFALIFTCALWYQNRRFENISKIIRLNFSEFKKTDIVFSLLLGVLIALILTFSV